MASTHLGLLEHRRSLGWANALTLTRANLPALTDSLWLPVLAVATDIVDGRLARRLGTESAFGASADALIDTALWTWYAFTHEPSRTVRVATLLAWAAPVLAVTTASFRRGAMVDAPRPHLLRPAATMQVVLAGRALLRQWELAHDDAALEWDANESGRALRHWSPTRCCMRWTSAADGVTRPVR